MPRSAKSPLARPLSIPAILLAGLLTAVSAHANLSGPLTVKLIAPGGIIGDATPVSASDVVTPGSGIEISTGDGTNIGAWMLTPNGLPEQIDFSGNSILVRVAAGNVDASGNPVTGYLGRGVDHAHYEFDGLSVAGATIIGFNLGAADGFTFTGFNGVASPASPSSYIHLVSPSQIVFDLDTLVFKDRGNGQSNDYAEFRIDLITNATPPVPEPAQYALMLGGLALLGGLRRCRAAKRSTPGARRPALEPSRRVGCQSC